MFRTASKTDRTRAELAAQADKVSESAQAAAARAADLKVKAADGSLAAQTQPMTMGQLMSHTAGFGVSAVYDKDGQLITGSFMDYAMPRAKNTPSFVVENHPVPTKLNPVGAKGCGEAGCSGGLPTVMNAVVDALSEYGVRHIEMPATPAKIWNIINAGHKLAAE